ncbi:MAG: dihydropteroate synthase [Rhizomicrobium sp.]
MSVGPKLLGIVNITEDSFSDGGRFLAPDAALAHARSLLQDGADILDLGGASSNPDAKPVPPDVEISRLAPVVAALRTERRSLSVDSFSLAVQRWAIGEDVDFLNDVQGFPQEELYPELAAARAKLIVMHSVQGIGRATRITVAPSEILNYVLTFFDARISALAKAGVSRERLILDPGMGFFLGADPEASFAVLRGLPALKSAFGLPLLVSVSRKSFLRALTGRPPQEAGAASLAAELFAIDQGADYIRTHNPGALRDALLVRKRLDAGGPMA